MMRDSSSPASPTSSSSHTPTPSTTPTKTISTRDVVTCLVSVILGYLAGLWDGLAFNRVVVVALKSPKIRVPILNCLFLNGVIFIGSYILFHFAIYPILQYFLHESFSNFFSIVYYIIWLIPVYAFTFLVNNAWYSDIAAESFILTGHTQHTAGANFVKTFTDSVYNSLLCLVFFLCGMVQSLLPSPVGPTLYFIQLSWLYAFYSFESKWTLRGKWGLRKRITYFEEHWVYMLGFGTPFTLAFYFFSFLVSAGVYSFLYPFFLILAIQARHQKKIESKIFFIPQRFPIFLVADNITRNILGFFSKVG